MAMHSDFIFCPTLIVERFGLETKLVQTLPPSVNDKTKDIIHYSLQSSNEPFILYVVKISNNKWIVWGFF